MKMAFLLAALVGGTAIAAPAEASVDGVATPYEFSLDSILRAAVGTASADRVADGDHVTFAPGDAKAADKTVSTSKIVDGVTYTPTASLAWDVAIDSAASGRISVTSSASSLAPKTGRGFSASTDTSFRYRFTTTDYDVAGQPGSLTVTYGSQGDVPAASNKFGLRDGTHDTSLGEIDYSGSSKSGSAIFGLLPNTEYVFDLYFHDIVNGSGTHAAHTSAFTFNVTGVALASAVPEPASWALMIGGVAVAGGSLRTRRRVALTA